MQSTTQFLGLQKCAQPATVFKQITVRVFLFLYFLLLSISKVLFPIFKIQVTSLQFSFNFRLNQVASFSIFASE
jgi:hypothetical protein